MALYHFQIGFPKNISIPYFSKLQYSRHAMFASMNDRYGAIELPNSVCPQAQLIEVEVERGQAVKFVFRQHYNAEKDLVIVVLANNLVKTVWINLKADKHKTLKKHLYSLP